ncbi:PAS domain S-box-containing protein [Desulfomicrobium macestii]|uniref:histidine kinase n=1 Tax=Desulfomicrobium macestii TaxID=90731 RepID=A0ABR9H5E1_9BACT|nr:PAS domain S-box protein [Desulfomicrobium macestii]MBE1425935.1 PAS domain S-box-containing protein [Desulfomicrobium macestii]
MTASISLQRQLDHLNRAQRHAGIGSFEHDMDTGATFWSDEQYCLLGFEPGTVTPSLDKFLNLLESGSRARFLRRVSVCFATRRELRTELRYTPENGSPRVAQIRAEFEPDESGHLRIIRGTFQDVTERRAVQSALRQSESRYRSIFENALEGIYQTTPEGVFLSANASMAKILRYDDPADMMAGIRDIGRDLYADPADRKRYMELLEEHVRVMGFETQVRRKDGSLIWVTLNSTLIQDAGTGRPCLIGTMEDISTRKRYELSLIESDQRFRNLLQQISCIAVSLDNQNRIIFSNPFLQQLTGWNATELGGRDWFEVCIPPDQREAMTRVLADTQEPEGTDTEILTRLGARRLIRWNTVPDINVQGETTGVTCMGVDITAIKMARDTLSKSALLQSMRLRIDDAAHSTSNFASLMRTVHQILGETIDAKNLITALINTDKNSLEFPYWVDEMTDVSEAAPRIDDLNDPENRRLTLELLRGNVPNILSATDMAALAKTGKIRLVGVIPQSWIGVPLKVRGKGIGALIVQNYATPVQYTRDDLDILLEVSEQIALAIERQRHDELSQTAEEIFHDIPSGLFIYKCLEPGQLVLETANPAALRLIHKRLEEARGMLFTDIWPRGTLLERYLHCLRTKEHFDKEAHLYEDDRIRGYFRIHAFALPGEKLAVAFEDVTERELVQQALIRAKEAAESANRAKSEFLANISHEVRTPLNGIMGMLQLALQSEASPELAEYMRTALASSRNLLRVLNDVLDFTKVDAGKMELLEREFDLDELLSQAVNFFKALALDKKISLALSTPANLGRFVGDEGRLRQILFNLMGNALKFTDTGSVTLEAWPVGEQADKTRILFTVQDKGIGIPTDKLNYVFESFTQVDGTYSRRYQGTGLGLPIVKRLVTLMGGNISVESMEGEGTTIFFVLPLRAAPPLKAHVPARPKPVSTDVGPLGILLVEDDMVNMTMAKRMLEKLGHGVICARNGLEALDCLHVPGVDVVLMDIQMPEMDGIEATEIIRSDPRFVHCAQIPIIALTAHAMAGDEDKFLSRGMNAYLSKPFDHVRLQELLHRFFG